MLIRSFVALGMACTLVSCKLSNSQAILTELEAVKLADAFMSNKFPQRRSRFKPDVVDGGKSWVVVYRPPLDAVGSTPVVVVHKLDKEVVAEFGF